MVYYISQQPLNPVARILAALLAVLAFAGAFFFGLIILAVVVGLGLLLWLGIRLRMWWIMRHAPQSRTSTSVPPSSNEVIDAEYTVVSKEQDK